MESSGCSIIFVNGQHQILLFLRDDKPDIPYPNMWDIPGGHMETDETPDQCIIREMKEEMNLDIENFHLFSVIEFSGRREYTYWKRENLDIGRIELTEGQRLRWFTEHEAEATPLANGFNRVVKDFFIKAPFRAM